MKTRSIAVAGIAVALFIVVLFRFYPSKAQPSFSIEGKWKMDSAYPGGVLKDSFATALLLAVLSGNPGKEPAVFQFNADSTLVYSAGTQHESTKYYRRDSTLFIKVNEKFEPYQLRNISDSSFSYIGKDSVVVVLKKK